MAITPVPCTTCGGGDTGGPGQPAFDVEQNLLCDILPDGTLAGTALMVTIYDEGGGNPVGPPTPVDPVTGDPYVVQGVLQPCPAAAGCMAPHQFCFTSSATTDEPGRMYDLVLPIAQGFGVEALIVDLVEFPTGILWDVTDVDGSGFAADLQAALQSRFPGETVTVTPPAILSTCGAPENFTIHIECVVPLEAAPNLVQVRYNAGQDLVQNPSFNTTPPSPTPAPLAYVKRADQVAGFPTTADVNCTAVANRGWETNDKSNVFELWGPPGSTQNTIAGTTPTPRGTAVQEINAFGSGATPTTGANAGNPAFGVDPDTLWQTFNVPAPGNFTIRVVVGARSSGAPDNIPLRLSTGDVGAGGTGDIINTTIVAGNVVTELGGSAGPWTTFSQTVPLAAGSYTLAFTGPDQAPPTGDNAFGGLFTDMRVFQDAPGQIAAFANDDDTCTEPVSSTSTVCQFWQGKCSDGDIVGWTRLSDGLTLDNAAFWAQVPAPICCPTGSGSDTPGASGNLVQTYPVCGTVGGVTQTLERVIITDQSGGAISDTFIGADGAPVVPATWQPGPCPSNLELETICYTTADNLTPRQGFRREVNGTVTFTGDTGAVVVPDFWRAGPCPDVLFAGFVCDITPGTAGGDFVRTFAGEPDLGTPGVDSFFSLPDGTTVTVNAPATVVGSGLDVPENAQIGITYPPASVARSFNVANFDGPGEQLGMNPDPATSVTGDASIAGATVDATAPDGAAEVFITQTSPLSVQVNGAGHVTLASINYTLAAVAETVVRIKQFRNADGTSFYETLDGAEYVPVGTVGTCDRNTSQVVLCDFATTGPPDPDGIIISTRFLRTFTYDATGALAGTVDTDLVTGAPYTPTGVFGVGQCSNLDVQMVIFCDLGNLDGPGGTPHLFYRDYYFSSDHGSLQSQNAHDLQTNDLYPVTGPVAPYPCAEQAEPCSAEVVIGEFCYSDGGPVVLRGVTTRACDGTVVDRDSETGAVLAAPLRIICPEAFQTILTVCDDTGPFLIQYVTVGGAVGSSTLELDGTTPHVVVGDISTDCDPAGGRDVELLQLCDNNGPFLRVYQFGTDTGSPSGVPVDLTLAGAPYVPVGPVVQCTSTTVLAETDVEILVLCDSAGTRFLRRYVYDAETPGAAVITNTALDGATAFAPVGAVSVCAANPDFDFLSTVLCDANGTQFIQRLTFNSATGVVTATTNTTLTGAAFVPVAPVALCASCCPIQIGSGCYNAGSGRYTALRLANGTISLIDSVTGVAVLAANIIVCASDDVAKTLTAQHRLVADADAPWTPGADVVGTLTSVTYTVLSGTATVTDQNGTVAAGLPAGLTGTWNAEDDNTLGGPQSIDAIGGSVYVLWTQR